MLNIKHYLFGERKRYSFTTKLSIEECVKRLGDSIARKRSYRIWDYSSDIGGTIDGSKFQIWKITYPKYRNSWNPIFYGRFDTLGENTVISGYLDVNLWVKWFTIYMISMALFLGIFFVIIGLKDARISPWEWIISLLAVPITAILIIVLVRYGFRLGQREYNTIIGFLSKILEATPSDGDINKDTHK
jgi:hypothetical protein